MLKPLHINRYADIMIWALTSARSGRFKKKDIILLRYDSAAVGLAEALQARLLESGFNPVLRPVVTPLMEHNSVSYTHLRAHET